MWLSRAAIFPVMLLALCVLAIAGCNGGAASDQAEMGKVALSVDTSRIGQLYRQRFDRLLARHAAASARYELTARLVVTESEDSVTMTASLSLYDSLAGRVLDSKGLDASASIGGTASLYGSDAAKRFARERLAEQLAEKTYRYLIVTFARRDSP